MKRFMVPKKIYWFFGIVFIVLIWIISSSILANPIILPSLWEVMKAFFVLLSEKNTYIVLLNTFLRLLIGLGISFFLALILATLSIIKTQIAYFIRPLIIVLKTIPVASIIILLLIMIGHEKSPIAICGLVVFPLLYEVMYQGMKQIDHHVLDEVKTMSTLNWTVVTHIHLPLMIPYLITGIIQSFGLGLKVMVMGELLAQPNLSIGKMLLIEKQYLHIDMVFAWTFILIIIVGLTELMMNRWQKKHLS